MKQYILTVGPDCSVALSPIPVPKRDRWGRFIGKAKRNRKVHVKCPVCGTTLSVQL